MSDPNKPRNLYIDGGCSGNGQLDMSKRKMVSVVSDKKGRVLVEKTDTGGSNNIAELIAVKEALMWCATHDVKKVRIHTDSKNNLAWVYGNKVGKKVNDRARVMNLKTAINALRQEISMELVWVPRDDNLAGHYIEQNYGN
jgi:ribonuclease HI